MPKDGGENGTTGGKLPSKSIGRVRRKFLFNQTDPATPSGSGVLLAIALFEDLIMELYLDPGQPITAKAIGEALVSQVSEVALGRHPELGLAYEVKDHLGGVVAYILPPQGSDLWGIAHLQGARKNYGFFRPYLQQGEAPYGRVAIENQASISTEEMQAEGLAWGLEYALPWHHPDPFQSQRLMYT
jgi:hypothetical protein